MGTRLVWAPRVWAVLVVALMLWPVLGHGFVLTYDMVWVPDLALRPDALGLGSGLPRAVPSDAVVAVLDQLVTGVVLQKLVLIGAVLVAGLGAVHLAPRTSLTGRLVAVTVVEWSPLVVERLVLGAWPVLLGYAVAPWLVVAARRARAEGRVPAVLPVLLVVGSLSASAGVVSAALVLVLGATRRAPRTAALLVAAVLAANAPWLLTGLLHASAATSDPAGARAFALHGEGSVPGPLAALTLGGVWNADVVPASRQGALGWVALAVAVALAGAGARAWWRGGADAHERVGLVVLWVLGWGTAVLGWALPDVVGAIAADVPGGGLLRDGSRPLVLCAPLLVALVAHGSAVLVARLRRRLPAAGVVVAAAALVLLPVAVLPDAASGAGGRLRPVDYPASYAQVRAAVAPAGAGDVLLLPFTSYRAPTWNGRRPVLDPMGRVVTRDVVSSDELVVSGRLIAGEDPRGDVVRRALAAPTPQARATRLAAAGVGTVVEERGTGQRLPVVAGRTLLDVPDARVLRLGVVTVRPVPAGWRVTAAVAWLAFLALLVVGPARSAASVTRDRVRLRHRGR